MKAIIRQLSDGEGLSCHLQIAGTTLEVMDRIGCEAPFMNVGDSIDVELEIGAEDEDETWEQIFSGNPDKRKELKHLGEWSYLAYGEIIAVSPVVVDCGVTTFEDVICTSDPACIGEFIAFTIKRLDAFIK